MKQELSAEQFVAPYILLLVKWSMNPDAFTKDATAEEKREIMLLKTISLMLLFESIFDDKNEIELIRQAFFGMIVQFKSVEIFGIEGHVLESLLNERYLDYKRAWHNKEHKDSLWEVGRVFCMPLGGPSYLNSNKGMTMFITIQTHLHDPIKEISNKYRITKLACDN